MVVVIYLQCTVMHSRHDKVRHLSSKREKLKELGGNALTDYVTVIAAACAITYRMTAIET